MTGFRVQKRVSSALIMNVDVAFSEEIHAKEEQLETPAMLFQVLACVDLHRPAKAWLQEITAMLI